MDSVFDLARTALIAVDYQDECLTLQLHFPFDVCTPRFGLMGAAPE